MRVIGGEARGRQMVAPKLPGLRPTSDRVREAIFDILEARDLVEDARFVDVFAGSGALGIEALSRGAAGCTFVEADRRAVAAIEANLASLDMAERAGVRIVRADAVSWLRDASGLSAGETGFDVGLVDPPYRYEDWAELLAVLPATTVVLEHGKPIEVSPHFHSLRSYRYGGTLVTLASRQTTDKDPA